MAKILRDADLKEGTHVLLEYKLPSTEKRIDFLITGELKAGRQNAVIIELKQWQKSQLAEGMALSEHTWEAGNAKPFIHPINRCPINAIWRISTKPYMKIHPSA